MCAPRLPTRAFSPLLAIACLVSAPAAQAQQVIMLGEYGLMGAELGPPGVYVGAFGYNLSTDRLKTPGGSTISGPRLDQWVFGPLVEVVTPFKLLGATYAAAVAPPWANIRSEAPRLGVDRSTGTSFSQLYVVPVILGWQLSRADVAFHYAFYAPTGKYTAGATDNTGLGMWVNEVSVRGTYFLDATESWHASLSAFYDFNGEKEGTDWTQGNPLTLMGGVGRNYGKGTWRGWAGLVGYAQWQVTSTKGADVPAPVANNKSRVYALGPEFTTLQGAFTLRYEFQFGGEWVAEGNTFYGQFVMPVKLFK